MTSRSYEPIPADRRRSFGSGVLPDTADGKGPGCFALAGWPKSTAERARMISVAMELFWQAVLIGLAVAAPVGPMALLCLERTLARGPLAGFVFGLGIACADASYALVAAFGVHALTQVLLAAIFWIRLLGSLAMLGFGIWILLQRPAGEPARPTVAGNWRAFGAAFGLTLANPPTVVFFAGVFASLAGGDTTASPAAFTLGVLTGSALWWLVFSILAAKSASLLAGPRRIWVNRLAGGAVVGFALAGLGELLR